MQVSNIRAVNLQTLEGEIDSSPLARQAAPASALKPSADVIAAAREMVDDAQAAQSTVPPAIQRVQQRDGARETELAISVRDVNGDGFKDAVVTDAAMGRSTALINDGHGGLAGGAVSLQTPGAKDLALLSRRGPTTGQEFLSLDLNGDDKFMLAVKQGERWMSLGSVDSALLNRTGSADDPQANASANPVNTALGEAEARYQWVVGQFGALLPVQAWDGTGQIDPNQPGLGPVSGFVQMLNDNDDQDIYSAFDSGSSDPSDFKMFDSFGGVVKAFDPYQVGFNVFLPTPPPNP